MHTGEPAAAMATPMVTAPAVITVTAAPLPGASAAEAAAPAASQ
jgi:hypothetical protein